MLGVDKAKLEESLQQGVSKYTREGVNVADRHIMIKQLLELNEETKYVIYAVDAWMFTGEGLSNNSYKLFLPFLDDESVDQKVRKEASFQEYFQSKLIKTSRYSDPLINGALRGHLENWSNFKFGKVDTIQLIKNIHQGSFRKIESKKENRETFEQTLELLRENDIHVVLVYVPTIEYYNTAEPKKFELELEYFRNLERTHPSISYLEFIEDWESRHEYFFDPIHLNPEGQQAFTKALSDSLKNSIQ